MSCILFYEQTPPMKKTTTIILIGTIISLHSIVARSQSIQGRPDKLYTMSGMGFSFPIGETADYFSPKFSTSIGINLGLGKGGLFLYPKASLHAYRFDEITPDAGHSYALQKGRATTYLLNVALGYRKIVSKFAFYGFAGGGGGIILTPRAAVSTSNSQVELDNKSNGMSMIEAGAGSEYNIGGASLFIEASYMNGFSKIQGRNFNAVPITVGIKPNMSKLFNKK
jgi:hypothetical protein